MRMQTIRFATAPGMSSREVGRLRNHLCFSNLLSKPALMFLNALQDWLSAWE
jgi:hypothetical protein